MRKQIFETIGRDSVENFVAYAYVRSCLAFAFTQTALNGDFFFKMMRLNVLFYNFRIGRVSTAKAGASHADSDYNHNILILVQAGNKSNKNQKNVTYRPLGDMFVKSKKLHFLKYDL